MTAERRYSRCIEDPDFFLVSDDEDDINDSNIDNSNVDNFTVDNFNINDLIVENKNKNLEENNSKKKKSVVLCLGAVSTMGMVIKIVKLLNYLFLLIISFFHLI